VVQSYIEKNWLDLLADTFGAAAALSLMLGISAAVLITDAPQKYLLVAFALAAWGVDYVFRVRQDLSIFGPKGGRDG
jgi:hypothetical protein